MPVNVLLSYIQKVSWTTQQLTEGTSEEAIGKRVRSKVNWYIIVALHGFFRLCNQPSFGQQHNSSAGVFFSSFLLRTKIVMMIWQTI